VIELPLFLIGVRIHDYSPLHVRATVGDKEKYILLGRDILNQHKILLDGPELALEIGPPAQTK
jgi:hypothetical protein